VSLSRTAADLALSMPAKSRLGRFKIAFHASFGVVRRAPLIHNNTGVYIQLTILTQKERLQLFRIGGLSFGILYLFVNRTSIVFEGLIPSLFSIVHSDSI